MHYLKAISVSEKKKIKYVPIFLAEVLGSLIQCGSADLCEAHVLAWSESRFKPYTEYLVSH